LPQTCANAAYPLDAFAARVQKQGVTAGFRFGVDVDDDGVVFFDIDE
jgi:hypothetical protein